jgi:hypothetical protein
MVIHRRTVDNYSYTVTQAFMRSGATGLVGRISVASKEISLYKIPRSRLITQNQSPFYEDSRLRYDVSFIPTFTLKRLSFARLVNGKRIRPSEFFPPTPQKCQCP